MKRTARGPTINLFAKALTVPIGPIKAPERVCIWRPGPIVGDFGANVWDAQAAADVMADYARRGNDMVPIDIEHNTNPDANPKLDWNDPPRTGGYATLELDSAGALWARFAWSAYARQQIEEGERRAISPDWRWNPKTGRPVRLDKISLVHNPGTYGIGLLASARAGDSQTMDLKMFLAALEAALTAEDPKAAIQALVDNVKALAGDAPTDVVDPAPDLAAAGGGMTPEEQMKAMAAARDLLAKLGMGGGRRSTASSPTAQGQKPDPNALLREARAAGAAGYREEREKDNLIASADGSPGMTAALAAELRRLPLSSVKAIIPTLPAAPSGTTTSAAQTTTAAAVASAGVVTGALAGAAAPPTAPQLTAAEQAAIDRINGTGLTPAEKLAQEQRLAAESMANGVGRFSAMSQFHGAGNATTVKPS